MKYLLSWACKHLNINSWQELGTIEDIIKKITTHITETANYQCIDYSESKIAFATIINNDTDICLAQYNDEKKVINLPPRKDAEKGLTYIIIQQDDKKYRFAAAKDLYSETKNHLLGAIYGNIEDNINYLKKIKKNIDYVIKIDNTSINNRPDLFSHRGLARELSLLFNKKLILESEIFFNIKNIKKNNKKENKLFDINSSTIEGIAAITGDFQEKNSLLSNIFDITPIDITSHSYLIDLSNYIMLDIGQPLHIFDKQKINTPLNFTDNIIGEMDCLDHTTIKIEKKNNVIENDNKIISLVGIMGSKYNSVTLKTKEILIESVFIKKEIISQTYKQHNKKTESAIRNEKGSSINAIEAAILRFLKLININFKFEITNYQFFSKQNNDEKKKITLSLLYTNKVIGMPIELYKIERIFLNLGFIIIKNNTNLCQIEIEIPWWRKDISNEDDLIEEIVRNIGYDSIPLTPPLLECRGTIKNNLVDDIKNNTILLTNAQEIISYGISNEEQKKSWGFESNSKEIILKNPYSDRQKFMASSFLPNFLDIIYKETQTSTNNISLFEINPLWNIENNEPKESLFFTFCNYNQNNEYNFYQHSQIIKKIFYQAQYYFDFTPIESNQLKHNLFSKISGHIYCENKIVGICGFIDPIKINKQIRKGGAIFSTEINISLLNSLQKTSISDHKYPYFDISLLINKNIKIISILNQLKIAFGGIMHTEVIDWFETKEWNDCRSVTIRIFLMNNDINELYNEIKQYLIERECIIR